MNKILSIVAALAIQFSGGSALAHEGHEIDRELLASKIREQGLPCASVIEAHETGSKPTVFAIQCSDDHSYRMVVNSTGLEITATAADSAHPPKADHAH